MGSKIEEIALSIPLFNLTRKSAITLSSRAAKRCLKKAGLVPANLGILINTGIYRDSHIAEPAVASLIQRRIGANPVLSGIDTICSNNHAGTFSFDLNNGGCGLISGMRLVDGFIQSGRQEAI